jgi:hypothetical protein
VLNSNLITYYFKNGTEPFISMSDFSDNEIQDIMTKHFPKDTRFHKNPLDNILRRRSTELWLHQEFKNKGGKPKIEHPIYFTLGNSSYLEEYVGFDENFSAIEIPLEEINELEISFTYPDSVVSQWLHEERNEEYYNGEYHGHLFMLDEIQELVEKYFITGEEWRNSENRKYDFFIEAQIWNLEPLMKYKNKYDNIVQSTVIDAAG